MFSLLRQKLRFIIKKKKEMRFFKLSLSSDYYSVINFIMSEQFLASLAFYTGNELIRAQNLGFNEDL